MSVPQSSNSWNCAVQGAPSSVVADVASRAAAIWLPRLNSVHAARKSCLSSSMVRGVVASAEAMCGGTNFVIVCSLLESLPDRHLFITFYCYASTLHPYLHRAWGVGYLVSRPGGRGGACGRVTPCPLEPLATRVRVGWVLCAYGIVARGPVA